MACERAQLQRNEDIGLIEHVDTKYDGDLRLYEIQHGKHQRDPLYGPALSENMEEMLSLPKADKIYLKSEQEKSVALTFDQLTLLIEQEIIRHHSWQAHVMRAVAYARFLNKKLGLPSATHACRACNSCFTNSPEDPWPCYNHFKSRVGKNGRPPQDAWDTWKSEWTSEQKRKLHFRQFFAGVDPAHDDFGEIADIDTAEFHEDVITELMAKRLAPARDPNDKSSFNANVRSGASGPESLGRSTQPSPCHTPSKRLKLTSRTH